MSAPPTAATFGQRLRALRQRRRWTAMHAAVMAGVDRATMYRWEAGDHEPRLTELILLAEAYEVTLDGLVWGKP